MNWADDRVTCLLLLGMQGASDRHGPSTCLHLRVDTNVQALSFQLVDMLYNRQREHGLTAHFYMLCRVTTDSSYKVSTAYAHLLDVSTD